MGDLYTHPLMTYTNHIHINPPMACTPTHYLHVYTQPSAMLESCVICMIYVWLKSNWIVHGCYCLFPDGCEGIARPPRILTCTPSCPTYAICNDTNSCKCFEEYFPEYDADLNLISCNMDNTSMSTLEPKTAYLPGELEQWFILHTIKGPPWLWW